MYVKDQPLCLNGGQVNGEAETEYKNIHRYLSLCEFNGVPIP